MLENILINCIVPGVLYPQKIRNISSHIAYEYYRQCQPQCEGRDNLNIHFQIAMHSSIWDTIVEWWVFHAECGQGIMYPNTSADKQNHSHKKQILSEEAHF